MNVWRSPHASRAKVAFRDAVKPRLFYSIITSSNDVTWRGMLFGAEFMTCPTDGTEQPRPCLRLRRPNAQFAACQNADFSFELTPVRPCSSASSPILLELSDTILDNNRYRSRRITCDVALVPFLLMTTLMRKVGRAVGSTAASSLVYSTWTELNTIRYEMLF